MADADGSGRRVVVAGAVSPSWSPDGTRLLFGRSVIDAGDTWVVNLDGSNPRRLGAGTGSWSPDGQWIAMIGASGAEPDVTVVRPGGTGGKQLGTCWDAAWSPDGSRLACTHWQGSEGELRIVNVADGSVTTMLGFDGEVSRPAWVTDEEIVVVLSGIGSPAVAEGDHLYLLDIASGELRLLLDRVATVTSVAPGGTWLAVTIHLGESDIHLGESDIHLVSLDGEERPLTADGTSSDAKWQPRQSTAEP